MKAVQTDWLEPGTYEKDVCRNRHRGTKESVDAFEGISPSTGRLRLMVLEFIRKAGQFGASADEASVGLNLMLHTTSARFTELKAAGHIRHVGRRETRSGAKAAVYVVE